MGAGVESDFVVDAAAALVVVIIIVAVVVVSIHFIL